VSSIRPVGGGRSVRLEELTPSCRLAGLCARGACGWDSARFRKVYRLNAELIAGLTRKVCEPA